MFYTKTRVIPCPILQSRNIAVLQGNIRTCGTIVEKYQDEINSCRGNCRAGYIFSDEHRRTL